MQIQPREVNNIKLDFEFTIECMTLAYFAGKPWLSMYVYAWYAWMQYALTNGWIFHWVARIGEPFGSWLCFEILGDQHQSI
jgi:hypothetical protein